MNSIIKRVLGEHDETAATRLDTASDEKQRLVEDIRNICEALRDEVTMRGDYMLQELTDLVEELTNQQPHGVISQTRGRRGMFGGRL